MSSAEALAGVRVVCLRRLNVTWHEDADRRPRRPESLETLIDLDLVLS
jgi:hypothetical protein